MKIPDIKRIAEAARPHGLAILDHWLPGGTVKGPEYVVLNPHRADNKPGSLSINTTTGTGKDFADGPGFKDYVGVVAFAQQSGMSEAAEALAQFLGIPITGAVPPAPTSTPSKSEPKWRTIAPVSDDAPAPPGAHFKLGKPDHVHAYPDTEGRILGYICRWDVTPTRRKEFHPLTYCADANDVREWRWQSWAAPRPLYGLDTLAHRPDAAVVLHEGEKSVDAGRHLLPDHVNMTWPNGADGANTADFGPLKGRTVWLWPDADAPGAKAMQAAAKALRKAGAAVVKIINLQLFEKCMVNAQMQIVRRTGPLPTGWDAADALAEGWTPAALAELLKCEDALLNADAFVSTSAPDPENPDAELKFNTGPFELHDDGLWFVSYDKEQKKHEERVCAWLQIPALARDGEGASWSPYIEFIDRDNRRRQEVISYKLFLGQGHDGIKLLADLGLEIEPTAKALDRLRQYINGANPKRRVKLVPTTGWHGRSFVLPAGAIGEVDVDDKDDHEVLMFDGSRRALGVYEPHGTLEQWKSQIAMQAVGNPRLMFLLSVALAGPLLRPLGLQSAAFHLTGDSSTGKSAGLYAAGSTWGPSDAQVHSWRQTSNAAEYVAAIHNDALLINDEIKEGDGKEVSAMTYMLMNGRGKERAHHAGGLREATMFRIVMLSSGEIGLADHLAAAGQKHYAGQEVRLIELDADAGAGHGMWNDVALCAEGGKTFSDNLKKFSGRYYGTAGRAFIKALIKHIDALPAKWRTHQADFAASYKPQDAGGQVQRVMSAFCLVAFAGELAAKWEIVPWPVGAATDAAGSLFEEWAKERPTTGNSEEGQILAHVRSVLERTWQSKFVDWHRTEEQDSDLSRMAAVHDSLGFRKKDTASAGFLFYVTRERFKDEFAAKGGFKYKRVAAVLKARDVLRCDDDGTTLRETLPSGDPRSYCIVGDRLWNLTP